MAIISAIIPYATIPADLWLTRTGRLRGGWRRSATDDARDHRWHDRLFRTVVRRPVLSCVILLVAVAVVFVSLLAIGPPLDHLPES